MREMTALPATLGSDGWAELFGSASVSLDHLELRDSYALDSEDERYRWWLVATAALVFAVAAGAATLSVWRIEKKGPLLLIVCGVVGSALCIALPAAAPADALAPGMWRAAVQGAVLIFAFLLLAAWYVRNVVRTRT